MCVSSTRMGGVILARITNQVALGSDPVDQLEDDLLCASPVERGVVPKVS